MTLIFHQNMACHPLTCPFWPIQYPFDSLAFHGPKQENDRECTACSPIELYSHDIDGLIYHNFVMLDIMWIVTLQVKYCVYIWLDCEFHKYGCIVTKIHMIIHIVNDMSIISNAQQYSIYFLYGLVWYNQSKYIK